MLTLHQLYELRSYIDYLIDDFKNETWENKKHKEILEQMVNVMYGRKAKPNRHNRNNKKRERTIKRRNV